MPKILTYWTLVTSCFILVAAGHGAGPIIMIEIMVLQGLTSGSYHFDLCFGTGCSYDNSIAVASLIILGGQFITLIANIIDHTIIRVLGVIVILFGYLFLCHNLFNDSISSFSFFTGIPFFSLSIIVLILVAIQTFRSRLKSDEEAI